MVMGTFGSDLLQRIASGDIDRPTSEVINRVRSEVSTALSELIDFGCRARPLTMEGVHVGFIRGVGLSERRQLYRWFTSPEDRITQMLLHGTTLSPEAVRDLDGFEARYLFRMIDEFTEADLSLYPYVSAFSTTSVSEVLWHGRGASVSAYTKSRIELPGGWSFPVLAPSDHARLWAGVAASRERSKRRLDDTFNAAMVTRAMAGKGADKLFRSLKKTQDALISDSDAPWENIVKVDLKDINFEDGWGHSHQDDSVEGVVREVTGMVKMDKHEKFMEAFYQQQMEQAQQQEALIERRFSDASRFVGVEDSVSFTTPEALKAREDRIRELREAQDSEINIALTSAQESEDRKEQRATGARHPFRCD